jgi:phosphate transport system substrate-binding protein
MRQVFGRCALAALPLCVALTTGVAPAGTLVVHGSTTFNSSLMVPYQADIEAVAGHQLRVVPSRSNLGLLALLAGEADLAMISSPLQSEIDLLSREKPDLPWHRLQGFLVHRTRVAFAVNPANPLRGTNPALLRRVLSGEIDNWKDFGGADRPIRVVTPPAGGGVVLSIERQLLGGQRIAPRHPVVVEFGPLVAPAVARDPDALGLAQLGELQRHKLPELMLNTMIEQQLFLVTRDAPTPAMEAVIDAARRVADGLLD